MVLSRSTIRSPIRCPRNVAGQSRAAMACRRAAVRDPSPQPDGGRHHNIRTPTSAPRQDRVWVSCTMILPLRSQGASDRRCDRWRSACLGGDGLTVGRAGIRAAVLRRPAVAALPAVSRRCQDDRNVKWGSRRAGRFSWRSASRRCLAQRRSRPRRIIRPSRSHDHRLRARRAERRYGASHQEMEGVAQAAR